MDRIYNHIVVRMPRWRMDVLLDGGETYQRDHAAIQMWAAEHIEILDEHDLSGAGGNRHCFDNACFRQVLADRVASSSR